MCPCSKVKTVFGREFKSYFDSPVAYVFLVAFLVLVGFLTFGVAMFYERRQADLTPFFFWHPWVYPMIISLSSEATASNVSSYSHPLYIGIPACFS